MKTIETISATFARNRIGSVWEMAKNGPVAVESSGKTIAYVLSPEDFERSQLRPRKLGFARDLVGEFDVVAFNSVTLEEMGFQDNHGKTQVRRR